MNPERAPGTPPVLVGLGEILWDLLPTGKQLGGAPANFAYHAHALGAQARLVSRIGRDALGQAAREQLAILGLSAEALQVDPVLPTGTAGVSVSAGGQPQCTILEPAAWDARRAHRGQELGLTGQSGRTHGSRRNGRANVLVQPEGQFS